MAAEMNKTKVSALEGLSDQWGTDKLTDDYKTGDKQKWARGAVGGPSSSDWENPGRLPKEAVPEEQELDWF